MIEFSELEKLEEKRKWLNRFAEAYGHGEVRISDESFGQNVTFFVAKDGGAELGFIRINVRQSFLM